MLRSPLGYKFGCALDVASRVASIERNNPALGVVELCGEVAGDRRIVESIIRLLNPYRLPGEWFRPMPDVERFATLIREGSYVELQKLADP